MEPPARTGSGVFVLSERIVPIPAYVASLAPRDLDDARASRRARAAQSERRSSCASTSPRRRSRSRASSTSTRVRSIATWRTRAEGGDFSGSAEDYRRLVREAYAAGATVDVEHASGLLADPRRAAGSPARHRLAPLAVRRCRPTGRSGSRRCAPTGARAVKLVCGRRRTFAASLAVAAIQARDGRETRRQSFPWGPRARPAAFSRRSRAPRSSTVPSSATTAPGQIPLERALRRLRGRRAAADRGALRRRRRASVAGSLSPRAPQRALPRARRCRVSTSRCPSPTGTASARRTLAFDPPFRGFSVTQPWKLAAAARRAAIGGRRATGAANTLVRAGGRWRAENTDVDGIFDPLADHDTGEGRTAVILGAGGTARAAVRRGAPPRIRGARRGAGDDAEADAPGGRDARRLARAGGPRGERGGPVLERDSGRVAPTAIRPPSPDASSRTGRSSSTASIGATGGDADDRRRRARRAARSSRACAMFAAQAVRQARLFGVDGRDARGGLGAPSGGVRR